MIVRLPAVALAIMLLSAGATAQAGQHLLQIAYTAELRGNLLPCACPAAPLGGIARRVGWIDSLRTAATDRLLILDAGSAIPIEQQYPLLSPEDFLALRSLHVEAARHIAYDAMGASPDQRAPGGGLAWLRPNEARVVERDGLWIVLAAVHQRVDPTPAAAAIATLAPAELIVLLCAGDLQYARAAARITGAAVVVVSRGACFPDPVWDNGVLFLGSGRDGKYTGLAHLDVLPHGTVRLIGMSLRRMDATVPPAPDWREEVEELVLTIERKEPGALTLGE